MGITENLGLSTYNTASGSATTFLEFRLALAGTESNMELIDEYAGGVSGSIIEIQSNLLVNINASLVTPNYYEATSQSLNSYLSNSMIALEINVPNTGSVTLNINELGTITLKKIGSDGELTNLESGDLKADRHALFVYDGTYYVLMGATTADQVNIYGNENNFVSISGSGTLQNSGISGSSILFEISGSNIMSDTSGSVVTHNISGITSGSYTKVHVDVYGHIISGSSSNGDAPYIFVSPTESYELDNTDYVCLASGSIVITLPSASAISGKSYIVKNIGAGSLIEIVSASGLIDGGSQIDLSDLEYTRIISDNANWWTIG